MPVFATQAKKISKNIYMLYLFRQGMEYGLQQCFVAKYDSCFLFILSQILTNPLWKITSLCIFCGRSNVAYFLGLV